MRGTVALLALACVGGAARADPPPRAAIDGELFAGYRHERTASQRFDTVELERGEAGLGLDWSIAEAELRIESVRSAGPDSLTGIDGDSLVLRVKRAWAGVAVRPGGLDLSARGGLIADPWVATLERSYDARAAAPTLAESSELFDTSDLGGALTAAYAGRARIDLALTNGEGRTEPEQNRGKNLTAVGEARLVELPIFCESAWLLVAGGARDGSRGLGSARDHRAMAALALAGPHLGAGVEVVRGWGASGRPDLTPRGAGGWLGGVTPIGLGGMARFDVLDHDGAAADDWQRTFTAALTYDLVPSALGARQRLRVLAGLALERFGLAAPPLPGAAAALDRTVAFVVVEARGGGDAGGR